MLINFKQLRAAGYEITVIEPRHGGDAIGVEIRGTEDFEIRPMVAALQRDFPRVDHDVVYGTVSQMIEKLQGSEIMEICSKREPLEDDNDDNTSAY